MTELTKNAQQAIIDAAIDFLIGKDWHKMSPKEERLYDLVKEQANLHCPDGFVRRRKH